jgi:predicted DCC family thiol-disulfide oxidoreductase YuxK
MFFTGLPPRWLLWLILTAAITLTLALLVGWHARVAGVALAAVSLVGNTFEYSLGKINHDDLLLMVVLLTMSFSGWERRYSVDARRGVRLAPAAAWPVAMLAMLVGFAMFSAGLPKAMGGWLDPATQNARANLLQNYYVLERPTWLGGLALDHVPAVGWEVLDWATVVLELAFLPAAFSRRAMLTVCGIAVFLHAGIYFTMEIAFYANVVTYAMFVDWSRVFARWGRLAAVPGWLAVLSRARGWAVLAAGVVLTIVYGAIGNPVVLLLGSVGGNVGRQSLAMLLPCVLVALAAGRSVVERIADARSREPSAHPVLLFDGVCGLCSRAVDFVLAHDRRAVFRFAALQSAAGQAALARHRLPSDYSDSMVLIAGGRCYRYSTAVLLILRRLGLPWAALWPLVLVPPPFRDMVYEHVAAHRYRWFGKLDTCRVPTAAERERFVADSVYN